MRLKVDFRRLVLLLHRHIRDHGFVWLGHHPLLALLDNP